MTIIDLFNNFWSINRTDPMPPMYATMYFYLLHICNIRRWVSPFELHTRQIELELGLSRATINDVRNNLKQRGLIDFKTGKGKAPATYEIIGVNERKKGVKKVGVVQNMNDKPYDKSYDKPYDKPYTNFTTNLTTRPSTPYYIEDIKTKDIKKVKKESPSTSSSKDDLVDYISMLPSEQIWVENVKRMTQLDDKQMTEMFDKFADHCRAYEKRPQSLTDCKRYFLNWLNKTQPLNQPNGTRKQSDRSGSWGGRRRAPITPGCGLIED